MVIRTTNSDRIHNRLLKTGEAKNENIGRIASGKKINKGSDDPAGLAMVMAFESQTRGLLKQISSRQDEISMLQTAEGALSSTSDMLQRINELAVQSANGTLTDSDRQNMQLEVDQLRQQINLNAQQTQYNGKKLLDGSLLVELQSGETFSAAAADANALNLQNIDLVNNPAAAMSLAGQAVNSVSAMRSNMGAAVNGISAQVSSLQTEFINATSAQSRIQDADMAAELINLSLNELQSKFAIKAFKMQDENRATVLQLLAD